MLGKGGAGKVYKGLNSETSEYVAVKEVLASSIKKENPQQIKDEIDLMRNLNHDNIVRYIGEETHPRFTHELQIHIYHPGVRGQGFPQPVDQARGQIF